MKNPSLQEKVPCNCSECKTSNHPYFHDYKTLCKFKEKGKTTRECALSVEDVDIERLLKGILDPIQGKAREFIQLIDKNRFYDFFGKIISLRKDDFELNNMRNEFLDNGADSKLAQRIKIWIVDRFQLRN